MPDQETMHCLIGSADNGLDEELAMSLCGYNPKAFQIVDGILQVRDFCGDWVDIDEVASSKEEPPINIYDDYPEPPDFSACGKVNFLVDQFIALSDAAWENIGDPFTIESGMRAAVSQAVNLDRKRIYQWLGQIILLEVVLDQTDFNDPTAVANAKCIAVGAVLADGVGKNEEVDAVVSALTSAFTAEFGDLLEWHYYSYWKFVQETFGSKDCRLLLEIGATDTVSECECVATDPYTGLVTWNDSRTIHTESQGSALAGTDLEASNNMYFRIQGGQNNDFQEVHWDENLNASGNIQEMQIEFPQKQVSDTPDYYPATNWGETNPTLLSNYMEPPTIGPPPDEVDFYPQPGRQVVIMKWDVPTDLDGASLDFGVKINPKDQSVNRQQYRFNAIITYAGDLR